MLIAIVRRGSAGVKGASRPDKIRKEGLVVETIASGHGRLGTTADLTAALAVKPLN